MQADQPLRDASPPSDKLTFAGVWLAANAPSAARPSQTRCGLKPTLRAGEKVNTNTVEGYYSVFKRGMAGVYQHCSERHLHRYLSEFDFRYSNRRKLGIEDVERSDRALLGVKGKRLTYKPTLVG